MVIGTPIFLLNEYLNNVDVAQRKALTVDVERLPLFPYRRSLSQFH
jgi:hypothetical protein